MARFVVTTESGRELCLVPSGTERCLLAECRELCDLGIPGPGTTLADLDVYTLADLDVWTLRQLDDAL